MIRGFLFCSLLAGLNACSTLVNEGSTDAELHAELDEYVVENEDKIAFPSCEDLLFLQRKNLREEGETPTCDLPAAKHIAHACTWKTFNLETKEPMLSFAIRNESCTFSNEEYTRATCNFEYITVADFGYRVEPSVLPNDIWKSGQSTFVNITYGDTDEMGHLMFFTEWKPDQNCSK